MPFPNVTLPSVWDIPVAVGVPALLGQSIGSGVSASASTALAGLAQNWLVTQAAKKWGIFNAANQNVLSSAHVHSLEYESSYAISDAPQEDGAFASYNKVRVPYTARVTLLCDGSERGSGDILSQLTGFVDILVGNTGLPVRQGFLATLDGLVKDTNYYHVVTPEKTYTNANIVGYRFRRAVDNGLTLLVAEVALQEVRKTFGASYSYTNTAHPWCDNPVQLGTVQPGTTPQSTLDQINKLPVIAPY